MNEPQSSPENAVRDRSAELDIIRSTLCNRFSVNRALGIENKPTVKSTISKNYSDE